jgi:hypothetical protein
MAKAAGRIAGMMAMIAERPPSCSTIFGITVSGWRNATPPM